MENQAVAESSPRNAIERFRAENEKLQKELEDLKVQHSELEQTNQHLVSATWRERVQKKELNDKLDKLFKEMDKFKLFYDELEATNNHLVSATFRERDMKKQLKETLDELQRTQELVQIQSKRISDSINYARKIQFAINASEEDLLEYLPESFIFYKPKDTVSGDFPWYYKRGKYIYLAAVDCTGHGVPGAMMSMIGNLLLNDIVNNDNELTPSQVLLNLHEAVVRTLKQDLPGSHSSDGMDAAMCRINIETNELVFAGAHRPLLLLSNNEVISVPGDRFPIGGMHHKGKNEYSDYFFQLTPNDAVFIYSDGYVDQVGGPDCRKFSNRKVGDILDANKHLSMTEYKGLFEDAFHQWKGDEKQLDDVIMIGFKI